MLRYMPLLHSLLIFILGTQIAQAKNLGLVEIESFCASPLEYQKLRGTKDLESYIKKCRIKSLENFLSRLPSELRKRYTLVYQSKGLGIGTPEYPRIILSGIQSDLIISTDSNKNSPLYGSLEIADYNDVSKNITFKKITFDSRGKKKPTFSTENPAECMQCHQNSHLGKNRFIWNDIPFWPGVYGSAVDRHFFVEKKTEPGWDLNYYFSEDEAYKKFILPKLEKEGLFKYLAKDLYSEQSKYTFRTGLRLFWELLTLQDLINMDGLRTHLVNQQTSADKIKYYLLYANSCFPEAKYSIDQILEKVKEFVEPQVFRSMLEKVQQQHQFKLNPETLNNSYEKAVLEQLWNFIAQQFIDNHESIKNENCRGINKLAKYLNQPDNYDCDKQFDISFKGHSEGLFLDQYGINQAANVMPVYLLLYLGFKAVDYPFEYWSTDRKKYSGYGTNRNSNMDLQNSIIPLLNFRETDPEIFSFFKERAIVHPRYVEFSELPYMPERFSDIKKFYDDFCPNIIGPKSKRLTEVSPILN